MKIWDRVILVGENTMTSIPLWTKWVIADNWRYAINSNSHRVLFIYMESEIYQIIRKINLKTINFSEMFLEQIKTNYD
jgi:hypothetical protein